MKSVSVPLSTSRFNGRFLHFVTFNHHKLPKVLHVNDNKCIFFTSEILISARVKGSKTLSKNNTTKRILIMSMSAYLNTTKYDLGFTYNVFNQKQICKAMGH